MTTIQQFDYTVDIEQAILWQYNDAAALISLATQKQEWYLTNQTLFWQNWFDGVFNLQTANQFGIAVWSFILNLPLFIDSGTEPLDDAFFFGFNAYTSFPTLINTYQNFNGVGNSSDYMPLQNGANFSDRGTNYILNLEEQRFILQLRYFQLTTRADITDINAFLYALWQQKLLLSEPFGPIWALDGLNMTMRYVFNFLISPILLDVIIALDLLPRPATVDIQYYVVTNRIFGLDSQDLPYIPSKNQNFNGVGNTSDYIPFVNGANFIPDSFLTFGE